MPVTILERLNTIAERLQCVGPQSAASGINLSDLASKLLQTTVDDKYERVLIRYTSGQGQFNTCGVKKFITLDMTMYTLDGERSGYHQGVWENRVADPADMTIRPPQPSLPLDKAQGPVEEPAGSQALRAVTKAHWTFDSNGQCSRLYAVGPALTHLVPLGSEGLYFSVACSQILTPGGTGWFKDAYGLKQSLGATKASAAANIFDPSFNKKFDATTIDTFRIVWPNGVPAGFDL